MAELSTAMQTALAAQTFVIFGAVEILMPGYPLRLLDGAGEVLIDGNRYVGIDPTYGTLKSASKINDDGGDGAPVLTLSLLPPTGVALTTLAGANLQGSTVTVRIGVVNPATGAVVVDPYVPFVGELDVPTVKWGQNIREIEFRCTSIAERLFMVDEGIRLAPSFHRANWPGEAGFDAVTNVRRPVPWGQPIPNPWVQTRTDNSSVGLITTLKT